MSLELLWFLIGFQVKHYVCDYLLQTTWMLGKFKRAPDYYWPLSVHCSVQVFGTFLLISCWASRHLMSGNVVLALLCFEFVSHFIMDRIKASPDMLGRFEYLTKGDYRSFRAMVETSAPNHSSGIARRALRGNTYFWWSLGFDQMIHHVTDLIVVYVLLKY